MAAMVTVMTNRMGKVRRWVADYVLDPGNDCTSWEFARFPDGRAAMRDRDAGNTVAAARVVWEIANDRRIDAGLEVRHLCGNGHLGCVNPRHLQPGTRRENLMDRVAHGAGNRGERHPLATLTATNVIEIKERVAAGERKVDVARTLGLSKQQVGRIANGDRWGHINIERG